MEEDPGVFAEFFGKDFFVQQATRFPSWLRSRKDFQYFLAGNHALQEAKRKLKEQRKEHLEYRARWLLSQQQQDGTDSRKSQTRLRLRRARNGGQSPSSGDGAGDSGGAEDNEPQAVALTMDDLEDDARISMEALARQFTITQEIFSSHQLFRSFGPAVLSSFSRLIVFRMYEEGETIIEQGAAADSVFVLTEGSVEMRVHGALIGGRSAPEVFGEGALQLKLTRRTASVHAASSRVFCGKLYRTGVLELAASSTSGGGGGGGGGSGTTGSGTGGGTASACPSGSSRLSWLLTACLPVMRTGLGEHFRHTLSKIATRMSLQTFTRGERVFGEREPSFSFFLVKSGTLHVEKTFEFLTKVRYPVSQSEWREVQRQSPHAVSAGTFSAGDVFGQESLLLYDAPLMSREFTVTAASDSVEVFAVSNSFAQYLKGFKEFRREVHEDFEAMKRAYRKGCFRFLAKVAEQLYLRRELKVLSSPRTLQRTRTPTELEVASSLAENGFSVPNVTSLRAPELKRPEPPPSSESELRDVMATRLAERALEAMLQQQQQEEDRRAREEKEKERNAKRYANLSSLLPTDPAAASSALNAACKSGNSNRLSGSQLKEIHALSRRERMERLVAEFDQRAGEWPRKSILIHPPTPAPKPPPAARSVIQALNLEGRATVSIVPIQPLSSSRASSPDFAAARGSITMRLPEEYLLKRMTAAGLLESSEAEKMAAPPRTAPAGIPGQRRRTTLTHAGSRTPVSEVSGTTSVVRRRTLRFEDCQGGSKLALPPPLSRAASESEGGKDSHRLSRERGRGLQLPVQATVETEPGGAGSSSFFPQRPSSAADSLCLTRPPSTAPTVHQGDPPGYSSPPSPSLPVPPNSPPPGGKPSRRLQHPQNQKRARTAGMGPSGGVTHGQGQRHKSTAASRMNGGSMSARVRGEKEKERGQEGNERESPATATTRGRQTPRQPDQKGMSLVLLGRAGGRHPDTDRAFRLLCPVELLLPTVGAKVREKNQLRHQRELLGPGHVPLSSEETHRSSKLFSHPSTSREREGGGTLDTADSGCSWGDVVVQAAAGGGEGGEGGGGLAGWVGDRGGGTLRDPENGCAWGDLCRTLYGSQVLRPEGEEEGEGEEEEEKEKEGGRGANGRGTPNLAGKHRRGSLTERGHVHPQVVNRGMSGATTVRSWTSGASQGVPLQAAGTRGLGKSAVSSTNTTGTAAPDGTPRPRQNKASSSSQQKQTAVTGKSLWQAAFPQTESGFGVGGEGRFFALQTAARPLTATPLHPQQVRARRRLHFGPEAPTTQNLEIRQEGITASAAAAAAAAVARSTEHRNPPRRVPSQHASNSRGQANTTSLGGHEKTSSAGAGENGEGAAGTPRRRGRNRRRTIVVDPELEQQRREAEISGEIWKKYGKWEPWWSKEVMDAQMMRARFDMRRRDAVYDTEGPRTQVVAETSCLPEYMNSFHSLVRREQLRGAMLMSEYYKRLR